MKFRFVPLAVLFGSLTACESGSKVVVTASLTEAGVDGPVADLPVRLLPYDRDEILDSLTRTAKEPEPQIPPDLLQQFQGLAAEERAAQARGDTALARFRAFRRAVFARADSVRNARRSWAEKAFGRFDAEVQRRLETADRDELADTTDASGTVTFSAEPGRWWVYARYTLPYSELYWNVPMEVTGDSSVVRLSRANAKERPFL
ncbi:MAG TPA: hypothetical protein VHG28_10935 [Longimicrobiaceae bacterium]|nr:hypothetical protein [Longimicrobiaceae bacterium]